MDSNLAIISRVQIFVYLVLPMNIKIINLVLDSIESGYACAITLVTITAIFLHFRLFETFDVTNAPIHKLNHCMNISIGVSITKQPSSMVTAFNSSVKYSFVSVNSFCVKKAAQIGRQMNLFELEKIEVCSVSKLFVLENWQRKFTNSVEENYTIIFHCDKVEYRVEA